MLVLPIIINAWMPALGAEGQLSDMQSRGKRLYDGTCIHCHDERGPGTTMLRKRLGKDSAVLSERDDMSAEYIAFVIRKGLGGMPWYRKTELTDDEISDITAYLTRLN